MGLTAATRSRAEGEAGEGRASAHRGAGRATPDRRAAVSAERVLFRVVVLFTIVWPIALLLAPPGHTLERFHDALAYFNAGRAYLAGADYYATTPSFRQWPLVAALWAPIAMLPTRTGLVVTSTLSLAGGLVGLLCLRRHLAAEGSSAPRLWWALVALGPPLVMLFYLGQMTGLCFGAYCAGLRAMRRRPWLAGILLALVGAKPHLAILALPVVISGGPLSVLTFGAAMLIWPLGSIVVAGPDGLVAFANQLRAVRGSTDGLLAIPLSSALPLGSEGGLVAQVLCSALLGAFIIALAAGRRGLRSRPGAVEAAAAVIVALLPYTRLYDLLFVIPALLRLGQRPDRTGWALVASWWLLPIVAYALLPYGGGGAAALIAPSVALLWLGRLGSPVGARHRASAIDDPTETRLAQPRSRPLGGGAAAPITTATGRVPDRTRASA